MIRQKPPVVDPDKPGVKPANQRMLRKTTFIGALHETEEPPLTTQANRRKLLFIFGVIELT